MRGVGLGGARNAGGEHRRFAPAAFGRKKVQNMQMVAVSQPLVLGFPDPAPAPVAIGANPTQGEG